MAITRTAHLVSAHLYFFPSGAAFTVPATGTASATSRPGHDPAIVNPTSAAAIDTGWIDMGVVESLKIQSKAGANVKIMGTLPGSGVKGVKKILKGAIERTLTAVLSEWSPLTLSLFFRAGILSDAGSTSEIALTQDSQASQDGWLYFDNYDGSNASQLLGRGYVWGNMEISGDGETDTTKNWSFSVEHTQQLSALNAVMIENA